MHMSGTFYYLPQAVEHVNHTILACEECAQNAPSYQHAPLHSIDSSQPMEILEVDFFGPMDPDPATGHKYFPAYLKHEFILTFFLICTGTPLL